MAPWAEDTGNLTDMCTAWVEYSQSYISGSSANVTRRISGCFHRSDSLGRCCCCRVCVGPQCPHTGPELWHSGSERGDSV